MLRLKTKQFVPAISLIELLVVIVIVGILAAALGPNIGGWNCRQNLRNDFENFNQYLNKVQSVAISRNKTTLVRVKETKRGYGAAYLRPFLLKNTSCTVNTRSEALEKQIPILTFPIETELKGSEYQCFYADGSADANSYTFSRKCGGKTYLYRSQIFGATGLISKEQYNYSKAIWDDL